MCSNFLLNKPFAEWYFSSFIFEDISVALSPQLATDNPHIINLDKWMEMFLLELGFLIGSEQSAPSTPLSSHFIISTHKILFLSPIHPIIQSKSTLGNALFQPLSFTTMAESKPKPRYEPEGMVDVRLKFAQLKTVIGTFNEKVQCPLIVFYFDTFCTWKCAASAVTSPFAFLFSSSVILMYDRCLMYCQKQKFSFFKHIVVICKRFMLKNK
jgi:hypothetical protein